MEEVKNTAAALDVINTKPQKAVLASQTSQIHEEAMETWERLRKRINPDDD